MKSNKDKAKEIFYKEFEEVANDQSYIWAFNIKSRVLNCEKVYLKDVNGTDEGIEIEFEITGEFEFLGNNRGDFKFCVSSECYEGEEAELFFIDPFSEERIEDSDFKKDFWFWAYLGYISTH